MCICVLATDVEYLCTHLFTTCMSPSVKCLCFFVHFLRWPIFTIEFSFLYSPHKGLGWKCSLQTLSPQSLLCFLILLTGSFPKLTPLILTRSSLPTPPLRDTLGVTSESLGPLLSLEGFLSCSFLEGLQFYPSHLSLSIICRQSDG